MVDFIFWSVWVLKIVFFCLLLPYLLYYRVYRYFLTKWHYQS